METQNYYKDTCALYNRAYNVISMEEYFISIASALNFNKLQKYTSNVHQIQETAQNSLTSQAI